MINADELCDTLATLAESYDGVCACAAHRQRFADLLAPYQPRRGWDWRPFSIAKKQGMSTCGLFAEAVEDLVGLDVPWHGQPYAPRSAVEQSVARNEQWARKNGCWQPYVPGVLPGRGCVLTLTAGLATHVLVVCGWGGTAEKPLLLSVDGGQTCSIRGDGHDGIGRQAIRRRAREWRERGGRAYLADAGGERLVHGWVEVGMARVRPAP